MRDVMRTQVFIVYGSFGLPLARGAKVLNTGAVDA